MNSGEQTITIPANGTWSVRVSNQRTFFCIATDGVYSVRPDSGDEITVRQVADNWETAKPYGKLTFRNRTNAAVTTTFWAGEERYGAQNVSVTVPAGVSVTNTPTVVVSRTAAAPGQFANTANAADAAKALAAVATPFRWALLLGKKSEDGTVNAGTVKVGFKNGVGEQPIEVISGTTYALPLPSDRSWDFQNVFFKVANDGDGLVVIFA